MKKVMRTVLRILRYPVFFVLACVLYFGGLQLMNNFHVVVPGELYRTAQLDAEDIARYSKEHRIRTIINLRGENIGSPWYDEEVAAAKANDVQHLNFRMSAKRELNEEQVKTLIEMMRTAPKPLLIHCKSGADRTGLAAALYMAGVEKTSFEEADKQLWAMYGHLPLPFIREYAMDRTFYKMKPMLGYPAE